MSVSVYWRIVNPEKTSVDVGWGSAFLAALTSTFGSTPIRLKASDADTLRAMDAAWHHGDIPRSDERPFSDLADAAETHGSIEVWGEW